MVYQIYYNYEGKRKVLFDIEIYVDEYLGWSPNKDDENKWVVELKCHSSIADAVYFFKDYFIDYAYECEKFYYEDFVIDAAELEELRGWLWEQHSNKIRTIDEASKDKQEWSLYVEAKVIDFCNKYGLEYNID